MSDAEGQARASASIDASGLQHMENLLREDTAGQFEIRGPLGRGGMAMVYLATETALGRKVAIKVLPPELTFGHGVERFKREAKTAAALDHPHIIPVYRVASGGKLFWYAMKFLEGRSLEDLLKEKQRLPLAESVVILKQVADALDYAHEHKVVHRDMKPANVMLDSRNRVVVTDFGIAKALTEGTLTASGSVIGTPFFMSPEQGMGKAVSGASDQYSVAVMAYRMLCGHVPFDGDSAIDILHKHCMMPPPPLDVLANGLPSHTGWAVNKALSKDPARRFPTVMAFVNALETPSPEIEMSTSATVMNTPAVTTASMAGSAAASATGQKPHTRKSLENMGTQLMDSGDIRKKKQQPPPPKGKGKLVGVAVTVVVLGGAGGWIALQGGGAKSGSGAPTDSVNRTQTQVAAVPPASGSPAGQQTGSATPVQKVPQQTPRNPAGDRAATSNAARNNRPADRSAPPRESAPVVTKPEAPQRGVVQIAVIGGFADVSVDGVSQGTKTRWPDTLPAGRHQILFERAGYISIDTSVVVRAGDTQLLKITLTPRQE